MGPLRACEETPRRLRAQQDASWVLPARRSTGSPRCAFGAPGVHGCGASEYSSANTRRRRALPRRILLALGCREISSHALRRTAPLVLLLGSSACGGGS